MKLQRVSMDPTIKSGSSNAITDVVASVSKREKVSDEERENILFRQAIRSASTR